MGLAGAKAKSSGIHSASGTSLVLENSRTSFICFPFLCLAHPLVPAKQRTVKQIDDVTEYAKTRLISNLQRGKQTDADLCIALAPSEQSAHTWTPLQTVQKSASQGISAS